MSFFAISTFAGPAESPADCRVQPRDCRVVAFDIQMVMIDLVIRVTL